MHRGIPGIAGTAALAAAVVGALWLAPPASAYPEARESCARLIADPAPGYMGPLLEGLACDYSAEAPEVSWTVPPGVTEARFSLSGGDDPIGGRGGQVDAKLPVTPGDTLVLAMGSSGAASKVGHTGTPLLVAGGGDGKEPNYVDPAAVPTSTQAPGQPNPPYPAAGRIYVGWYEGYVEVPENRCLVPRLRGRRPAPARRALAESGCTLGPVSRRPSRRALRGRVTGQSTPPGTWVTLGIPVGFTIGTRP